ncbi:MAG TPA: archaeosortase/exosortase family protein [Candidatus Norongarragalinales archaeon]|nr:archaeosortase/exosortase family protein [Candidatus Norongarragalinales archaeon]
MHEEQKQFLLRFFPAIAIAYAALYAIDVSTLQNILAAGEGQALTALGITNNVEASTIQLPNASFEIVKECTGLAMLGLFAALLYATPHVPRKKRAKSFLEFAPFILSFNFARLLLTISSGQVFGETGMQALHLALWIVDAFAVLSLWAFCTNAIKQTNAKN